MKLLTWIDKHLLKILLIVYVFFIPLYPKFPFQVVNYTYIAIRLDDFLTAILALVFFLDVLRKRIKLSELPFLKYFLAFWGVVFLAFLSGLYVTQTIDTPFVGLLNAARRIQYMMFFFIAYVSIKSVKDFMLMLYALIGSMWMVLTYGIAQRFYDFPAVSTMNPEFAKGRVLFLTPEARLSSTFAGHYDLAGYLVFLFPVLWGVYLYLKHKKKLVIPDKERLTLMAAGLVPLLLTVYSFTDSVYNGTVLQTFLMALQVPFNQIILFTLFVSLCIYLLIFDLFPRITLLIMNLTAILVIVFTASRTSSIAYLISTTIFLLYFKKFRYMLFVLVLSLGLTFVDKELIRRWFATIQVKQIVLNEKTGEQAVVQKISSDKLPAGTSFIKLEKQEPETIESQLLKDELSRKATMSGNLEATAEAYQTVSVVAADISIATRFQVSWPRAVKAFMRNPLLGTGPSSITESSDGDYFRWIGETGGLGLMLFMFIFFLISKEVYQAQKKVPHYAKPLIMGVIGGLFGLLINAALIDIFEASKVAYTLWFTLGIYVGLVRLKKDQLAKL